MANAYTHCTLWNHKLSCEMQKKMLILHKVKDAPQRTVKIRNVNKKKIFFSFVTFIQGQYTDTRVVHVKHLILFSQFYVLPYKPFWAQKGGL